MCTEVNSTMGLQATPANKRKHETTFESKDTSLYAIGPPPNKTCKWIKDNNNYIEAIEEQSQHREAFRSSTENCHTLRNGKIFLSSNANEKSDQGKINNNNNSNASKATTTSTVKSNNCSKNNNNNNSINNKTNDTNNDSINNKNCNDNNENININNNNNNDNSSCSRDCNGSDKSNCSIAANESSNGYANGDSETFSNKKLEHNEISSRQENGAIVEEQQHQNQPQQQQQQQQTSTVITNAATETKTAATLSAQAVNSSSSTLTTITTTTILPLTTTPTLGNNLSNSSKCSHSQSATSATIVSTTSTLQTCNLNNNVHTTTSNVSESSIAKLEVATAVHDPWSSAPTEPVVDCISKLQAVAVPTDPWGSSSTRSALATTLLSADELDDDDDDFEDDYEEEDGIIPTYCPALRYPPGFPTASGTSITAQPPRLGSYSPPHGYGSRSNYYSEPYPQQNCSRFSVTSENVNGGNNQAHQLRMNAAGSGFNQWQGSNGSQFYITPPPTPLESAGYTTNNQSQQQTIRCAENGKSYLELGCSTPPSPTNSNPSAIIPPPRFGLHASAIVGAGLGHLDARHHAFKRCCCDNRSAAWCNTNKNCYRDVRMRIRNLSMFKLSRFRQVSEQSLYRSVLICNTLKRIDREIEAEAKEMHQAALASAQQHQQQLHQQQQQQQQNAQYQMSHNTVLHAPHNQNPNSLVQLQQQQQHQMQHQDYTSVMNCARLANMDYPPSHLQQHQQLQNQQHQQLLQQQQSFMQQQHHQQQNSQQIYQSQQERGLESPMTSSYLHNNHMQQQQQQQQKNQLMNGSTQLPTSQQCNPSLGPLNNNCDASMSSTTSSLHPYDHYPFRDAQSGRATPYPCQPVMISPQTSPAIQAQSQSPAASTTQTANIQQTPPSTEQQSTSNSSNINSSSSSPPAATTASSSVTPITTSTASSASVNSNNTNSVTSNSSVMLTNEPDTTFTEDDSTRSINWSSVLRLSSQSALDPLNNNDLFAILPPSTPATATPVSLSASAANSCSLTDSSNLTQLTTTSTTVSISGSFTATPLETQSRNSSSTTTSSVSSESDSASSQSSSDTSASSMSPTSSTTATFTTLSTISAATHSLTSSYVSSMSNHHGSGNSSSTWEYSFLDMEFGLGTEFTELVPSCKLSSDELFKSGLTPVVAARYDSELEQPAHIMVGS